MQDSIFTKIINGEIPCHRIFEDDKVIAFLDIHPINPGHTLVVPKRQVDHLWDLGDDDYHYLMSVVKHIADHIRVTLNPPRVGVLVEGFAIPHCHIHIIPFYHGDDVKKHQDLSVDPDHSVLATTAQKLAMQ